MMFSVPSNFGLGKGFIGGIITIITPDEYITNKLIKEIISEKFGNKKKRKIK